MQWGKNNNGVLIIGLDFRVFTFEVFHFAYIHTYIHVHITYKSHFFSLTFSLPLSNMYTHKQASYSEASLEARP